MFYTVHAAPGPTPANAEAKFNFALLDSHTRLPRNNYPRVDTRFVSSMKHHSVPRCSDGTDAADGHSPSFRILKLGSCILLLFFTVSATIFTEASKLDDGTYPYNTFVIPCAVEAVKLGFSSTVLVTQRFAQNESVRPLRFSFQRFVVYAFPAFCYFVSNNCMFYIIRELGAATFQIMNNLKVLSTGVFMYTFLDRKLSWVQWKALIILVVGCMVTQLRDKEEDDIKRQSSSLTGYLLVVVSAVASGAGGAFSEKLLKGKGLNQANTGQETIHWQNVQFYVFGLTFGLISLHLDEKGTGQPGQSVFYGFNAYAYATVTTLAICGLLVSFILKYFDNVVKCFCATFSMLCVALLDSAMRREWVPMRVTLGIVLTSIALEQYNLS